MQLPPVLVRDTGDLQDAPDVAFALLPAHQHAQQLTGVEGIGLAAPTTPLDFDTRRVHHLVRDAAALQETVQPKAVAARFVATVDWRIRGQIAALFGLGDLLHQRVHIASANRPQARTHCRARRKGKLPLVPAQLEGQIQNAARLAWQHSLTPLPTMFFTGRCHGSSSFQENNELSLTELVPAAACLCHPPSHSI